MEGKKQTLKMMGDIVEKLKPVRGACRETPVF